MVEHDPNGTVQRIDDAIASIVSQVPEADREIHALRAQLLGLYADKIAGLDPSQNWSTIVSCARDAGLEKETFRQEFSCAWSTVTRWMNGETLPGRFARGAMRDRLVELVRKEHDREAARSGAPVAGETAGLRDVPGFRLQKASAPRVPARAAPAPRPRRKAPEKAARATD